MAKDTEGLFEIDPLKLDKQFAEQPKLMFEWGRKAAKARLDFQQAKSNLELVEAELDKKIRKNPANYGLDKVTEGAIRNTILTRPSYKKALAEMQEFKYEADVLDAGVAALDHRKRAIEGHIQLLGMDYFSKPSQTPKGVKAK